MGWGDRGHGKQRVQQDWTERASDPTGIAPLDQPIGTPGAELACGGPGAGRAWAGPHPRCVRYWPEASGLRQGLSWEPLEAVQVSPGSCLAGRSEWHTPEAAECLQKQRQEAAARSLGKSSSGVVSLMSSRQLSVRERGRVCTCRIVFSAAHVCHSGKPRDVHSVECSFLPLALRGGPLLSDRTTVIKDHRDGKPEC